MPCVFLILPLCLYEKAGLLAEIPVIRAGSRQAGQLAFLYKQNDNFLEETRHEPARLSRTQNSVTPFKPQSRLILFKSIMVLFEKAYPSFSGFVVGGCLQQSLAIVISAV